MHSPPLNYEIADKSILFLFYEVYLGHQPRLALSGQCTSLCRFFIYSTHKACCKKKYLKDKVIF